MAASKAINLLKDLLSGQLSIGTFDPQLSDILFELRQNPTPSEDVKLFSRIQLYIHELNEGHRDTFEIYMASQAALDSVKPSPKPFKHDFDTFIHPQVNDATGSTASPPTVPVELAEMRF